MCWNAEVSLNTFLFSTFATLLAYFNGIITFPNVLSLMSFVSMQLIEYFVWKGTVSIELLSKLGMILILVQPIFSIFVIEKTKYIVPLVLAYCIFISMAIFIVKPINEIVWKMEKGTNGHLVWHWLDFPLIVMVIWLGFLSVRSALNKDWLGFTFIIFTATASYLLYYKTNTWGSLWCWIANLVAFLLVFQVIWKDFGPKIKKMSV